MRKAFHGFEAIENSKSIAKRLVTGARLESADSVVFNYTLGIIEEGPDSVYIFMVRTMRLCQ